mmetsp:Transcript_34182/g.107768  ORF Transcript_34182/g.107768 Transcript_34182/m.107768 type:complete len:636 (-) Transcript_34182:176-2083(-)|eukprot:CAMPEP_0118870766 /NCGR_PEP_ID=MMETSP1163-20130328/13604_1 /TAXON_ID=124430 /ORGANISM="Phaeomonas parva, Strain CCMP2877" /LENGTH=635 /DNA_ID=CAMNT_0006805805 /DNA_START=113 /DNA_END=2020 /DNA_ORIENTATION=-
MAGSNPSGDSGVPRLLVGLDRAVVRDLAQDVASATELQYDFVCAPLFHPRRQRDANGVSAGRLTPATRSDTVLHSKAWNASVVGKVSAWMRFESPVERVRRAAEAAFKQEMAWASHLPLTACLLPYPKEPQPPVNYARLVNQTTAQGVAMQLWLRVPLLDPRSVVESSTEEDDDTAAEATAATAAWTKWDTLRSLCEQSNSLYVALELPADLPGKAVLDRWLGEPLKALILPTDIFLTNNGGYPTLSRRHQRFVQACLGRGVHMIIAGEPCHPNAEGHLTYYQYVQHLYGKVPALSETEKFSSPYNDFLQAPLQPLQDNLESQTYETFEMDPVKYNAYENAVAKALEQRHPDKNKEVLLMVVGAGRGPLVHASRKAAQRTGHALRIYAVEKNPNAVVTLRNRVITDGWDNVTVISSDMRAWQGAGATERADIIVSELLGSFGDNELSPECLDGVQWLLKDGGISIPAKYTSYLAPMSSAKLWNDVKAHDTLKMFETAFVVKLCNVFLAADPKATFVFSHPNPDHPDRIDNRRETTLTFTATADATIHGFAGYFDSQLFDDVYISIHPKTHSPAMFSWFPIYFPLRQPFRVMAGDKITAHMWRCVGSNKVWYEWAVSEPIVSPIHNPNGRSYYIGL